MITYKQAKSDLLNKVQVLQETIKFLKSNAFYEDHCQNCHNIMKVNVRNYGEPRKFCSDRCRSISYNKKKHGELNDKRISQ